MSKPFKTVPGRIDVMSEEEARQGAAEAYAATLPASLAVHWTDRVPPSNLNAERVLLGTLMANNLAALRMGNFIHADHFADPVHGLIFQAVMRLAGQGYVADAVRLKTEFEDTGKLDEVGGTAYLQQLLTASEGIIDVHAYAASISDAWLRRQVIDLAEQAGIKASRARDRAFGHGPGAAEMSGEQQCHRLADKLQSLATALRQVALQGAQELPL